MEKKPFADVNVELRDATNKVVSTQKTDKNGYLDPVEFIEGMTTLFSENYDKLTPFIFNLYDFDKDGLASCSESGQKYKLENNQVSRIS